jgi:hypothetical protein
MGRVITPDFRSRGKVSHRRRVLPVPAESLFSDVEIWSRDYATTEGMVFGVCALAAILSRHLGREGDWPILLVGLLEAIQGQPESGDEKLSRAARNLKDLLVSETSRENALDFSGALLIADLIEYTPRYRATAR